MTRWINKKSALSLLLAISTSFAHAINPIWSVDPTTPTSIVVPANGTGEVTYRVTNKTYIKRTLTTKAIQGITQDTSAGKCSSPFTLAPNASCLLTLLINGSQIPTVINAGPVVCKTNGPYDFGADPFLCAQPNKQDLLNIKRGSAAKGSIEIIYGNPVELLRDGPAKPLVIKNTSANITVNDVSAYALARNVIQDNTGCKSIPPLGSCTINLQARTSAIPGTTESYAQGSYTPSGETNQAPFTVKIQDVQISTTPTEIQGLSFPVRTDGTLIIKNESTTTAALNIKATITQTGNNLTIKSHNCPPSLEPSQSCSYVFTSNQIITASNNVSIKVSGTNTINKDPGPIPVTVTGVSISASPTPQTKNVPNAISFIIKNNSTQSATNLQAVIPGATITRDNNVTNDCNLSLAAGTSCTMAFIASAPTPETTIDIYGSNTNTAPVHLTFTGGVLTTTPTTSSFLFTSTSQPVVITNISATTITNINLAQTTVGTISKATGLGACTANQTLNPAASCNFYFTATAPSNGYVTFNVTANNAATTSFAIKAHGAELSVSPTSLEFPYNNPTPNNVFTVTNNGPATALNITATTTDSNLVVTPASCASLNPTPPGNTCTFTYTSPSTPTGPSTVTIEGSNTSAVDRTVTAAGTILSLKNGTGINKDQYSFAVGGSTTIEVQGTITPSSGSMPMLSAGVIAPLTVDGASTCNTATPPNPCTFVLTAATVTSGYQQVTISGAGDVLPVIAQVKASDIDISVSPIGALQFDFKKEGLITVTNPATNTVNALNITAQFTNPDLISTPSGLCASLPNDGTSACYFTFTANQATGPTTVTIEGTNTTHKDVSVTATGATITYTTNPSPFDIALNDTGILTITNTGPGSTAKGLGNMSYPTAYFTLINTGSECTGNTTPAACDDYPYFGSLPVGESCCYKYQANSLTPITPVQYVIITPENAATTNIPISSKKIKLEVYPSPLVYSTSGAGLLTIKNTDSLNTIFTMNITLSNIYGFEQTYSDSNRLSCLPLLPGAECQVAFSQTATPIPPFPTPTPPITNKNFESIALATITSTEASSITLGVEANPTPISLSPATSESAPLTFDIINHATVTVTNTTPAPLTFTADNVKYQSTLPSTISATLSTSCNSIPAGGSCEIIFNSSKATNTTKIDIYGDNTTIPNSLYIKTTGNEFSATPNPLVFWYGETDPTQNTVTITNQSTQTAKNISLEASPQNSPIHQTKHSNCDAPLKTLKSCTYTFTFNSKTPPATAHVTANFTVKADGFTSNTFTVTSTQTSISVSPTTSIYNHSDSVTYTITNSNQSPYAATGLDTFNDLPSPYVIVSNNCPAALTSGAQCEIVIKTQGNVAESDISTINFQGTNTNIIPVEIQAAVDLITASPNPLAFQWNTTGSNGAILTITNSDPTYDACNLSITTPDSPFSIVFNSCATGVNLPSCKNALLLGQSCLIGIESSAPALASVEITGDNIVPGKTAQLIANGYIYVTNFNESNVTRCASGACTPTQQTGTTNPSRIAITDTYDGAYITSPTNGTVTYCKISPVKNDNGAFFDCSIAYNGVNLFQNIYAISLYKSASFNKAYISDEIELGVFACDINSTTGALENCLSQVGLEGISLYPVTSISIDYQNNIAYITNNNSLNNEFEIVGCDINGSGELKNCKKTTVLPGITGTFKILSSAYSKVQNRLYLTADNGSTYRTLNCLPNTADPRIITICSTSITDGGSCKTQDITMLPGESSVAITCMPDSPFTAKVATCPIVGTEIATTCTDLTSPNLTSPYGIAVTPYIGPTN